MTDFYALLKQSIIDRGLGDARDRKEIYAQARRAVIKQLWDYRPPLAADEIDSRVGAYDTAVERIEADLQVAFANGEAVNAAGGEQRPPMDEPDRAFDDGLPVFSDWLMDEPGPTLGGEQPSPYAPPSRAPAAPAYQADDEHDDASAPLAYDDEGDDPDDGEPAYERGVQRAPQTRARDRWSAPDTRDERAGSRFEWLTGWLGTGEQRKVRLLAVAIAALFVVLVGVGALLLGSRQGSGVTLDIGVRREVSDAATAARIPTESLAVSKSYTLFDGRDPSIFQTTPDDPVSFDSNSGFARVASSTSSPGVKVLIGPGLAADLAGQRVRVTILARSSLDNGAANMRFAYQSGVAISYWQTANLGADYQPVGMVWRVPTMRTSPDGSDQLVIEPGIPGDNTGVDIKSIKIDVLAS